MVSRVGAHTGQSEHRLLRVEVCLTWPFHFGFFDRRREHYETRLVDGHTLDFSIEDRSFACALSQLVL